MLFRSFQSILDECLWALQHGESVESCLDRHPRQANRLRPYLELASQVSQSPLVEPRPIAQATAWGAVRERAAELRTGKRRRRAVRTTSYGTWLRPMAAAMAAFVAVVAVSSGTALASQNAMPDSPLYRVKLATEDVHLWLVFDDENEADILLDQSRERTTEIRAMSRDGKEIPAVVLEALRNRTERAAAIIGEHPEAVELREELRGQALVQENLLVAVQSDVKPSANTDYREAFASVHNSYLLGTGTFASALLSEDLADGVQEVSGAIERSEDGSWTVGGIAVGVDGRTISGQELVEGATAQLVVGVSSNGRRHALLVTRVSVSPTAADLIVSGEVEEVTSDHIVIAGQSIPITDATFLKGQPKKGKHVSVRISNTDSGAVAGSVGSAAAADAAPVTFVGIMETDLGQETNQLKVSGQTFAITRDTRFDFTAGNGANGARVRVDADANDDGDLLAERVTVLAADGPQDATYLIGTFERARPGIWVVSGIELGSPPGNVQVPEEGSLVAINAKEADDLLDALNIFVIHGPSESLVRLEGTATTIDDTVWNFGFGTVTVDSTTEVSGKPVAGARAIVWGSKDEDGTIEAVYVRVLDEHAVISAPADADSEAQN
jgi:hypothetical protein